MNELNKRYNIIGLSRSGGTSKNEWAVDFLNKPEIIKKLKKIDRIDVVIFLIGLAHFKGKKKDLESFRDVNLKTLINLVSAFEIVGLTPNKFILSSTISVYGESLNNSIFDENYPPKPQSPYAITKYEAELFLKGDFLKNKWILRFAPVYSKNFDLNLKRRIKLWKFYYKIGKGDKIFSLCNINNIVLAIDGIIEGKIPSGIMNISDKKNYSYSALLKKNNAKCIITIPESFLKFIYLLGRFFKINFLIENSVKLISDNSYPSYKINKYIDLNYYI